MIDATPSRRATARHCAALLALALLLGGCASHGASQPSASYDFGPLPALAGTPDAAPAAALPAIIVADVSGPAALDTERMQYRLLYADAQQARPYAYHHWSSSPLQLLTQRLKASLARSGAKVLSSTDAAASVTLLRVEADEFMHNFSSASQSAGEISVRASVFRGHQLLDQQTFRRSAPARTPDAAGGAQALALAADALAADIGRWLASLPLRP